MATSLNTIQLGIAQARQNCTTVALRAHQIGAIAISAKAGIGQNVPNIAARWINGSAPWLFCPCPSLAKRSRPSASWKKASLIAIPMSGRRDFSQRTRRVKTASATIVNPTTIGATGP